MGNERRDAETPRPDARLDLGHLRRDARTALELGVVALAPWELIEQLAIVAGLLEALHELPRDSPQAIALVPRVLTRARSTLEQWKKWHKEHLEQKLARG